MTPVQLQTKLDELRALPGETEWVEFKHAERNFDFDDLGKYFSALSNEANLKGQPFGWLGFGIKDRTHVIVGTQFRPNRRDLDSLKQEVAAQTTNRLTLTRFGRLGRKAPRVIKYKGTGRVQTEREWHDLPSRMGYAAGFEATIAFINSQLPQNEHIGEALRREARTYPEIAIRELVANTLIHQDFAVTGAGPMIEIFDDRMELTNPGEPLVDPQRFIDTPPRSRNEDLASFLRRLNICEERGSGIDKVITSIEMYQMPPPDFRVPPGSTQALLFAPRGLAAMDSHERNRACYQHCVLRYVSGSLMANASLRQRFGIAEKNAAKASRLIKDAVEAGLIKLFDQDARPRDRKYVPSWA